MEPTSRDSISSNRGSQPSLEPQTPDRSFGHPVQFALKHIMPSTVAMAAYYPFYTLKTLMQEGEIKNLSGAIRLARSDPRVYFRGIATSLVSAPPLAFISFANDQMASTYKAKVKRELNIGEILLFSSIASAVGGTMASVSEQIIANQQLTGKSFTHVSKQVVKTGIKGFLMTVSRDTVFGAVIFGGIPAMKTKVQQITPQNWGAYGDFFAGFFSCVTVGGLGALISQPMDVIKTRVQTQAGMNYTQAVSGLAAKGPKAFFSGLGPRAVGFVLVANVITAMRQVSDLVCSVKK